MTHREPKQTRTHCVNLFLWEAQEAPQENTVFLYYKSVRNKMLPGKYLHMCSHFWVMITPVNEYARDATLQEI